MDYTVENGIIYTEKGLPWPPRWFCDGRVAFQADQESITEIDYFGPKTGGSPIVFLKRFWKGMTFYTICRQRRQVIRAGQCEILPYGFSSRSELCEYGVFTADDRIYLTFRLEYDGAVAVEFYDDFLFFPETRAERDLRYGGAARSWERPRQEGHTVVCSYVEQGVPTSVTFSSDARLVLTRTSRNVKNILTLDGLSAGEEYALAISFSQKGQRACEGAQAARNRQRERYQRVSRKAPVLKSGRPLLDQFFQLAPMYHEALKTTDVKGAIRAQSTHYWVWGWDSMTSENAAVYWGDDVFIGQMLDCMEKYSDQEAGIAHAFSRDMRNIDAAAPPAQGMYITLLDLYRLSGGDWQRHYSFARNLYQRIAATEVRDIGLCRGTSLYPDFRGLIK